MRVVLCGLRTWQLDVWQWCAVMETHQKVTCKTKVALPQQSLTQVISVNLHRVICEASIPFEKPGQIRASRASLFTKVYFNNCKFGNHGPLEVFSQNAILALQGHFEDCCLAEGGVGNVYNIYNHIYIVYDTNVWYINYLHYIYMKLLPKDYRLAGQTVVN